MVKIGIDKQGREWIYHHADDRDQCPHVCKIKFNIIPLPSGSIEKLIGKQLKPGSEPVELK